MAKPMKIQFDPKDFSPKFKLAASVAAARDIKPILQNVKIKADKKIGIILQATDTELGIRIQFGCDVVNNGEAVLPTKRLTQILDLTGEEQLTIESTDSNTIVGGENEHYDLNTQSPDEFPNVEEFNESAYHNIPAKALKEMIRRTTFATDMENVRYALGGVYFEMVEDNISVVATDGRRLAWQEGKGECVNDHKVETSILPVRTLQILERVLNDKSIDEDDDIKMAISANRVLFQCKDVTLFSRLVEGRFPKWRSIIPKTDDDTPVTIECGSLLPAVMRAQIATSDLEPGIYFVFEKGKLTLKGEGKEIGNSTSDVPISFDGETKTIKLDPKFMTSFLRVLDSETVLSIFLPPDNEPVKITADDGGYVYVVMPMSS
jgi:DNA polymerase-3 subunit beta